MAGENWTLQYLRFRKRRSTFPTIWWPVAMPWGALLSAIAMFLMIVPARWEPVARVSAIATLDKNPSVRPLAVLRIHPHGAASLFYSPPDNMPGIKKAPVRGDYVLVPAPPLSEELRQLAKKWTLTENENDLFTGNKSAVEKPNLSAGRESSGAEPAQPPAPPQRARPMLLLAEQYRSHMDWMGMQRGLREAQNAGITSDLVFIEAEDGVTAEAIIGAIDLCAGLGLDPMFRLP